VKRRILNMPRRRRFIESNTPYEICFRARDTLPFSAHAVIELFIKSAVARAQRDDKLILCHDIWEGSHPHMIVVSKDAKQFVDFYMEVEKKITECLKALLGLSHLQIWEGSPTVIKIDNLETAKDRIAYLYANPAQDNISPTVEKFIGYSRWKEFKSCRHSLNASMEEKVPWIRHPSIPAITNRILNPLKDTGLVMLLRKRNKIRHTLKREPNRWMKCFQIESDRKVKETNEEILALLREKEKAAAELRALEKKQVLPASVQRCQEILKPHTPKKKERKISFQTSCKKRRQEIIRSLKYIDDLCNECYRKLKNGDCNVEWPPGTFRPHAPPIANALP